MKCPACGHEVRENAKFCEECGARVGGGTAPVIRDLRAYTPKHLAQRILTSRSALEGERKQVTVLFVDVKGSMELAARLDPEDWHAILDRFFQILSDGVHRFEGTINQYTGDGVMALFGAPVAHEDHAQRACYAALHLQESLRGYGDELRVQKALSFFARMGINSGEVVVGKIGDDLRMDYTAQGETVGLAARMQQIAEPGRTYLTGNTARLVSGYFALRDLGESSIKGVPDAVRVFELTGVGRFRTRLDVARASGLTRFVGRAGEVGRLGEVLERAIAGAGQIAGVVGEAGVGKSRLCLEFIERSRERGVPVFEAHCPAHGKTLPYLPILQLLRAYFGIGDRDTAPEARRKIAGALLLLDESFRESLPLLFDFLGIADADLPLARMAPEARQRHLLELAGRVLRARSLHEAAVLFVDDLHWIDPESDAFLAGMMDAVVATRTLLLVNYRPEYDAPWTARPDYRTIALRPLDAGAIGELLEALLGNDQSLGAIRGMIADRAAGNPFFAEELVRSLVDAEQLAGTKGGYRLAATPERVSLPATVESVLAARIDRAGEQEKRILQAAAVIGREFSERVLTSVAGLAAAETHDALERLCAAEFLIERQLYPEAEYAFRHPLTQEIAYRSQLGARRAGLHAAVARAIGESFPDRAHENAALVAHHWENAGEPLEAARSHGNAAEWIGVRDPSAAVRHWRRVRELLVGLPETEETLRLHGLACKRILGIGWRIFIPAEEADRVFAEGRAIAGKLGDRVALAGLLDTHTTYRTFFGGDFEELFARATEALRLAEEIGDVGLQVGLHARLAWVEILRADARAGIAVTERGIALAHGDPELGREVAGYSPLLSLLTFRAFFLFFSGRLAEGAAELESAIARSRAIGDEDSLQFPLGQTSALAYFSGDARSAVPRVLESLEITARIGHRWGLAMAHSCLGHVYLVAQEWKRALDALEEEQRLRGDIYDPYGKSWLLQGLAAAHLGLGRAQEALRLAEEAVGLANEHRWPYPEGVASLTLSRVLRSLHGRAAAGRIADLAARVESIIAVTGMVALRPLVEVERGELAGLLEDPQGRRSKLEEARDLFLRMGATGHAERLTTELAR